jgi:MoxR-like ATPase
MSASAAKKASPTPKEEQLELDIAHVDLPPLLEVSPEAIKRMDSLAQAFGYPDATISQVFKYAETCMLTVEHYRSEAERMRDSRKLGRVIKPRAKVLGESSVVAMSWHGRLRDDIELGRTIAVRGPAGNGKSTGVKDVLNTLDYNVYHLDCTDTTSVEQLVGGLVPEPDGKGGISMVFRDGIVAKAFADPKGAIQLDEFDALDPRTAMCLQSALHRAIGENKRWVSMPDHVDGGMHAKGKCPIVVTLNTYGTGATREYVGRNALDAASMDRFNSIIDTNYEKEEQVIRAAGFDKAPAESIVEIANRIRAKINENQLRVLLSTRRLIDIAEIMEANDINMREAFKREFYERLEKHDQQNLNVDIPKTRVGEKVVSAVKIEKFEEIAEKDVRKYVAVSQSLLDEHMRKKLKQYMEENNLHSLSKEDRSKLVTQLVKYSGVVPGTPPSFDVFE